MLCSHCKCTKELDLQRREFLPRPPTWKFIWSFGRGKTLNIIAKLISTITDVCTNAQWSSKEKIVIAKVHFMFISALKVLFKLQHYTCRLRQSSLTKPHPNNNGYLNPYLLGKDLQQGLFLNHCRRFDRCKLLHELHRRDPFWIQRFYYLTKWRI